MTGSVDECCGAHGRSEGESENGTRRKGGSRRAILRDRQNYQAILRGSMGQYDIMATTDKLYSSVVISGAF